MALAGESPGGNAATPSRDGRRDEEQQPLLHKNGSPCEADRAGNPAIIIGCISCTTLIGSLLSGTVTVATPQIGADLQLGPDRILWPVSMYHLATGCTLLISGSVADLVGCKLVYLLGCLLQTVFCIACGLSRAPAQHIAFRILSGLATSLCLPSAVGLVTQRFPPGRMRNLAFAFMGGGQPIGFGLGLTVGGIVADTIGWQWGFHIVAIANAAVVVLAAFNLPPNVPQTSLPFSWAGLLRGIDWVGALTISTSLALMSYYLSVVTDDTAKALAAPNVLLLSASVALGAGFFLWVHGQARRKRPALIPNSLWKSRNFTSMCVNVFLVWGAFNAFEQVANFVFQDVQELSALQSAFRFLPVSISGWITSVLTGFLLHRVRADSILYITITLSALSPLLMAMADTRWPYWAATFPAVFLNSVGADALFTISNLVISAAFPAEMQGLAGGVFNTVSQVGKSFGMAAVALVGNAVTQHAPGDDRHSPEALMAGFRACFWLLFASYAASLAITFFGFRQLGLVGRESH